MRYGGRHEHKQMLLFSWSLYAGHKVITTVTVLSVLEERDKILRTYDKET